MLVNCIKMRKRNRNTKLLFYQKGLEILGEGRREMNTILMKYFNSILFHKSGPADKRHASQSEFHEIIGPNQLVSGEFSLNSIL